VTARSALIVGAGPAGATLGYLLAGRRVPVTIVEKYSNFARMLRLLPILARTGLIRLLMGKRAKAFADGGGSVRLSA
jgi:choline dehydrogenase-like flavoprotein